MKKSNILKSLNHNDSNIQQSMSPKWNVLTNRPIEYFYAILQR
ncbi:hypothetical protein [Mesomycoplasma dispar]|nr:hypothetical protein [Mesomycoplasma dispar]